MDRSPPPRTLILIAAAILLLAVVVWRLGFSGPARPPALMSATEAATIVQGGDEDAAWQAMIDIGRSGDRSAAPLAMKTLTTHPSPRVRAAAANALARLEVWDSMPTLIDALQDADLRVRTQANLAIAKLVGFRYLGYDPDAPAADRARAIRFIREDYPQRKDGHLNWLRRRGIDPDQETP